MLGNLMSLFGNGGSAISAHEALKRIKDGAKIVDVREPSEFVQGTIQDAVNVPLAQIDAEGTKALERAGLLADEKPVLVICRSGARSSSACARLRASLGDRALNLEGGLMAWVGAGLPVTKRR
ncbi:rhodanese-like domain-containing protein [Ahniella affigens]|nr:rhodanese-like domain-containing protein [Ahniella affigens]